MKKTIRACGALLASIILLGVAHGAPAPIPPSLLGTHYISFDSNSFPAANLIGPFPAGYGGAFQGTVYNATTPTGNSALTTVWCVDYQLDVEVGSAYITDITQLSQITTPTDDNVRYGNIDSSTTAPNWANTLTPVNAFGYDTNTAQYRYALTAALVSEYDNAGSVIQPTNPDDDARNQSIQAAIWYITYNTDYNPGATWPPAGNPFDITSGAPAGYANWVQWAEANVNTVNLSQWAVVSGPALANGTLLDPTSGVYQTFLVQVAPEPAFYALLGLGLVALFVAARRRRTKIVTNA